MFCIAHFSVCVYSWKMHMPKVKDMTIGQFLFSSFITPVGISQILHPLIKLILAALHAWGARQRKWLAMVPTTSSGAKIK
mmetsp:Transcript_8119/g.22935  ORF Transcript_8119/g.22935 Transcript_8119/m.22935 type:complete len:80 (+) Transcript_8119:57-296(+)